MPGQRLSILQMINPRKRVAGEAPAPLMSCALVGLIKKMIGLLGRETHTLITTESAYTQTLD